jgi:E1A-binding protein p400
MELWSLMHFLMPDVFASHSQFRDWFCNPLTGMVEGSEAYNKVGGGGGHLVVVKVLGGTKC